jgi:hypothetical protein
MKNEVTKLLESRMNVGNYFINKYNWILIVGKPLWFNRKQIIIIDYTSFFLSLKVVKQWNTNLGLN